MKYKTINYLVLLAVMFLFTLFQMKNVKAENEIADPRVEAKIISGKQSKSNAWPWMVAILAKKESGKVGFCGGTLVAPEWVLTAAHCAENAINIKVLLGENNLRGAWDKFIKVTHSIIHPEYTSNIYSVGDIALLHLESSSSIKPVSLANDFDFQHEEGNTALAMGWGLTYQGNEIIGDEDIAPAHLQEVTLNMSHGSECNNFYFPDNIICLGNYDKKATCNGDSGGPLLLFDPKSKNWKQIGITSFGSKDCSIQYGLSVFTQVDKYQSFIASTINGATSEETPEEFLAKCVKKFSDYLGVKVGGAFSCDDSGVCLNTTGGRLMDIKQLFVSYDNPGEMLEFFENTQKQWHRISFSDIEYCQ